MADIGITPDQVLQAKNAEYLATLEPQEGDTEEEKEEKAKRKEEFLNKLKDAAKEAIQAIIDKINAIIDSIIETCEKIIAAAESWAAQIVAIATPDPTAPKAGAASAVSLKNSVAMAKSNLAIANAQISEVNQLVAMTGLPTPEVVNTTAQLISTASSVLNAIPV